MEDEGIKVVIEERLAPYAESVVIDYRTGLLGTGQFQVLTGAAC